MNKNIPEFGTKRENEGRRDGGCAVVFDPASQKYAVNKIASKIINKIAERFKMNKVRVLPPSFSYCLFVFSIFLL